MAGTLDVTSATLLHNGLSVDTGKPTTPGGTLSVGDSAVKGTLSVTRDIAVGGTLDVMGSTNLKNGAPWEKLTVAKETTLKDTLTVVGDKAKELGGALTVDGDTELGGSLTLDGDTTLKKKLKVATDATELGGSLTLDGDTTLKKKLKVVTDAT